MALIGAIQAGVSIWSGVQGLLDPKDAERNAKTDEAFRLAVAGDSNALLFLKQRTGEYGIVVVPGYGEVGGWASADARAYAKTKYEAALAQLRLMGQVEDWGDKAAPVVQGIAREAGYELLPQWVVWAGVAVVAYLVLRSAGGK
jgi:hypothetical protein